MAARSGRRTLEEKSWTESPVAAAAVVLVTVPETVTLPLGVAYVGLIDVIVIDIGCAGPACPRPAGPVPAALLVSPRAPLPPALDARARFPRPDPGTAPGGGGPAARNHGARGRPRAAVYPPRPRTRPGRRLRPGRLPRARPRRPRPGDRRPARAGAPDRRGLGGQGMGDRDRLRHRRAPQGQHDL